MSRRIILSQQYCTPFCNNRALKDFFLLSFFGGKPFVTRSPLVTVQLHITKVVRSPYSQLHHVKITSQMDRNENNRKLPTWMSWFPFLHLRRHIHVFILWCEALWFAYNKSSELRYKSDLLISMHIFCSKCTTSFKSTWRLLWQWKILPWRNKGTSTRLSSCRNKPTSNCNKTSS